MQMLIIRMFKFTASTIVIVIACVLVLYRTVSAANLGIVGKTYPIAERDVSEEVKERVSKINWNEVVAQNRLTNSARNFKPAELIELPRTVKDRSRLIDMEYTLEFDITDNKGNIIYPKGYKFNPLDYMSYAKTIVVLNGSDREQVEWFKSSVYHNKPNVMLMITDGSYYDLSVELGRSVYFIDNKMAERFQLQTVPSVIAQNQKSMEVLEIEVKHKNKLSANK